MPWLLRAIRELEPPLVTIENVKGLTYSRNLDYLHDFIYRLEGLGYCVDWRIINCADFGLPQVRERLVIVGRADLELPRWPKPTHAKRPYDGLKPWVSLAEGIGWDGEGWILETGADWKANGTRLDAQKRSFYRPAPSITGKSQSQWWMHRPSTTIAADPRIFPPGGHQANDGRDNRKYIKRSAARNVLRVSMEDLAVLQGFPRHYPFFGNMTAVARQIGNASPPLLIKAVAEANLA
jgi:DNA (cytosine-5)-methyltransferase 1